MIAPGLLATAAAVVGGYLIGSVPVPFLAVRLVAGRDLRTAYSGNVGVMNAAHVLGRPMGTVVWLAEALKGMGAAWLGAQLGGQTLAWAAIVAAVVGANWPVWLRWLGGRGNTTFGGGTVAAEKGVYLLAMILAVWVLARLALRDAFRATRFNIVTLPAQFAIWSWWQFREAEMVLYYAGVGLALTVIFLSKHARATDDHGILRGKR